MPEVRRAGFCVAELVGEPPLDAAAPAAFCDAAAPAAAMTERRPPPYQLISGDRYNISLSILVAGALAAMKENAALHPLLRWQLSTFTIWNHAFILVRLLLDQKQWDPFLVVNSVAIFVCFRTGFAQGLDDNLRKKFGVFGVQLTRRQFLALDHVAHTLPAALLVAACVRRGLRVHPLNSVYALGLATWFSFRQGASLDASAIYVPHPWKRLWLAGTVSMVLTPSLVNALVARRHGRAALLAATLLLPYLTTKLDPDLKKKYAFEYALQLQQARRTGPRVRQRGGRVGDLPRAQSYDPMRDSREETP